MPVKVVVLGVAVMGVLSFLHAESVRSRHAYYRSDTTATVRSGGGDEELYARIRGSLVIISDGKNSIGSGFIAEEEGVKYLYTNEHVTRDAMELGVTLLNGKPLPFSRDEMEMANDRDLVRFKLLPAASNIPALTFLSAEPVINQKISVYGNSDGAGVATEEKGRVNGVGPDQIEIDAKVVPGNSGSPVVDTKGEVAAILTYALRNESRDWTHSGTRYGNSEARRFALRVKGGAWTSIRWADYRLQCDHIHDTWILLSTMYKINPDSSSEIVAGKFGNWTSLADWKCPNPSVYRVSSGLGEALCDMCNAHNRVTQSILRRDRRFMMTFKEAHLSYDSSKKKWSYSKSEQSQVYKSVKRGAEEVSRLQNDVNVFWEDYVKAKKNAIARISDSVMRVHGSTSRLKEEFIEIRRGLKIVLDQMKKNRPPMTFAELFDCYSSDDSWLRADDLMSDHSAYKVGTRSVKPFGFAFKPKFPQLSGLLL